MFKNQTEYLNYTLPQLIAKRYELHGHHKVAIREKEFGIWQEYSWREYYETMKFFGLGLLSFGFQPEEVVGMITDNCFMWMASQMGVQAVGGLSTCIYQTSVPKEMEHVLSYTKAVFMVAQDQEQVDKVIEVREKIPSIQKVIFIDPKGMRGYLQDDWFIHIDDFLAAGKDFEKDNPGLFEENIWKRKPDDVCHLALTSGTTKLPKIAMLTHRNFINMILSAIAIDPIYDEDDYVSFLPPAWVGEQWATAGMPQVTGLVINCPDEVETAMADLREIGPHFMFGPPRIWENFCSRIQVDIEDATWLKRLLFNLCMKIGYQVINRKFAQKPVPFPIQVLNTLAAITMFRPLRDRLGLLRLRRAYTGGAALGPDMFRFFHALGVNLKQVYGQTESCGLSTVHTDDEIRFDTVGPPVPNTEIRISEEGEIQVRNPSLFKGYYQMPEETEKTIKDGWLCSGDAGYFDENGHLVVIDRVSDVMHIDSGEMFSPQFIENKLKFSPYIMEAVAFGDGLPYVAAFINIDMEVVGKWAEKRKMPYNTYMDLSQKDEVGELISKEVAFVNSQLPQNTNIKKFVLLYKELDADDEEMTRTGKVRRGFIGGKYDYLVDVLYGDDDSVEVHTEVKYQDGGVAEVKTRIKVYLMEG